MDILILDTDFQVTAIVDAFESMIWTDRYNKAGDFEFYASASMEFLNAFKIGYYLECAESEHNMIIEAVEIETDLEEGDHIRVTGRSLESILDRRIIWNHTSLGGNISSLQESIYRLVDSSMIGETYSCDAARKIPNFIFEWSTDPDVLNATIADTQYQGESLYEVVQALCEENDIGFKVILNSKNQFVFSLFKGLDRTYDNKKGNNYVIFSPEFDNIVNTDYRVSIENYKNVALVPGTKNGDQQIFGSYGDAAGLNRREVQITASEASDEGISWDDYRSILSQKGKEGLQDYTATEEFDGEMKTGQMFELGVDYNIGDIVQVVTAYGSEARCRITEIIASQDDAGYTIYPTFTAVENDVK